MSVESLPEPIRIVSDLHLGHPGCAVARVRDLRSLFAGAGSVIFNGDTSEARSQEFCQDAERGLRELRALLAEVGVQRVILLTGNHDPRASECHYLNLCEGKLLVTHGDFLFRYVSPWSKKLRHCRPRIDALLKECDERRLHRDFDYRLEVTRACCEVLQVAPSRISLSPWGLLRFVFDEVWPPTRLVSIANVWWRSPGLMAEALQRYRPEAQAVIFGHIHCAGTWMRHDRMVINTGAFLKMARARVVDVRENEVTVRPAQKGSHAWELGPVMGDPLVIE